MDFKAHIETAWKTTLNHIVPLVLLTLALMATSALTLGILAPVCLAGYMDSVLRLIRDDRRPHYRDIFSHMGLFLPLLAFGIAVFVVSMIGFALLFFPGMLFVLAVGYCCLFMLPLMTDQQLGLVDAVKASYAMVCKGDIAENAVVFILYAGVISLGGASFIGILLAHPLATTFLMSIYLEKRPALPDINSSSPPP